MRFPLTFTRIVGAGTLPLLGSDPVPATIANLTGTNVLKARLTSNSGMPVHRIAVGVTAPAGAPAVPVRVYAFDELTGMWFAMGAAATSLTSGVLAFFDFPTLNDCLPGTQQGPGSLEVAVVASLPGAAPDGNYVFAVGADLSCSTDAAMLAKLPTDPATQTTLAAILVKLADPATQTTLAAVLAKITADPATQTTLAALLALLGLPTTHTLITPNDATDITSVASKGLLISGSGNLYYTMVSAPTGSPIGPLAVQPGQYVPGQFAKIRATGATTATGIYGLS